MESSLATTVVSMDSILSILPSSLVMASVDAVEAPAPVAEPAAGTNAGGLCAASLGRIRGARAPTSPTTGMGLGTPSPRGTGQELSRRSSALAAPPLEPQHLRKKHRKGQQRQQQHAQQIKEPVRRKQGRQSRLSTSQVGISTKAASAATMATEPG